VNNTILCPLGRPEDVGKPRVICSLAFAPARKSLRATTFHDQAEALAIVRQLKAPVFL
jgi:hypothetical protein